MLSSCKNLLVSVPGRVSGRIAQFILGFFFSTVANAYDCTQFEPLTPLEIIQADVTVIRVVPNEDEVCKTISPLLIPLKDIRGRESDWYYCNQREPIETLTCDVTYKNLPAQIRIQPAMVIRRWKPTDALDIHIHTYLIPEGDWDRRHDNFTQVLQHDLSLREFTLNSSSGGRGPKADQELYYIRVKFYR